MSVCKKTKIFVQSGLRKVSLTSKRKPLIEQARSNENYGFTTKKNIRRCIHKVGPVMSLISTTVQWSIEIR